MAKQRRLNSSGRPKAAYTRKKGKAANRQASRYESTHRKGTTRQEAKTRLMYNAYKALALIAIGYILGTCNLKVVTVGGQQFYHFTAVHNIIKIDILKNQNQNGSSASTTPGR